MEACPACGVYPHKLRPPVSAPEIMPPPARPPTFSVDVTPEQLLATTRQDGSDDSLTLGARAALLVLLAIWGLRLSLMDISDGEIGSSFMHGILLLIHEAGHVFFRILGEFMGVAGGSLAQVLLPAGIGIAFLVKNRDPYGASVCFWWAGVSLIDLAPYIYDAVQPQLMLLSGTTGEDGFHDWIYLFDHLGGLRHSQGWGRFVRVLGIVTSFAALAWGGWGVWQQWRKDRA
jgi:hypothetical protein